MELYLIYNYQGDVNGYTSAKSFIETLITTQLRWHMGNLIKLWLEANIALNLSGAK